MDAEGLYQEDNFTDRRVGAIRRLTPVRADGTVDPARPVLFIGQAEIMTNMGPVPISFEIEGQTLAEAVRLRAGGAGRDRAHRAADPGDAPSAGFAAGGAAGRHAESRLAVGAAAARSRCRNLPGDAASPIIVREARRAGLALVRDSGRQVLTNHARFARYTRWHAFRSLLTQPAAKRSGCRRPHTMRCMPATARCASTTDLRLLAGAHSQRTRSSQARRGRHAVSSRRHHFRRLWRGSRHRTADSLRHRPAHHPRQRMATSGRRA